MTYTLTHNNRIVGSWSDEIINTVAKNVDGETTLAVELAEFFPDEIRKTLMLGKQED